MKPHFSHVFNIIYIVRDFTEAQFTHLRSPTAAGPAGITDKQDRFLIGGFE